MRFISSLLIGLAFIFPISSMNAGERENGISNYQKAILGLREKEIRANLPSEKMLDLCIPTSKRHCSPFTVFHFELQPGYCGLTIIAKGGVLKKATRWSCTDVCVYFDELTTEDTKQLQRLEKENPDTPNELFIGRWGWERPRKR
jgi:hypothetical protein